jgi:hypothetical protein
MVIKKNKKNMKKQILQITKKLKDNEINDKEAQKKLCFLFNNSNELSKQKYIELTNDFLKYTEKEDKYKPKWQTKNNIPMLYNSLNHFYNWLCENYW